jgi:hypothetical protein
MGIAFSLAYFEFFVTRKEEIMSGSVDSGDDLVSGRDNRSQSTTTIFMGSSSDESYSLGAVFVAGVTYLYDFPKSDGPLTGIRGLGWNLTWASSSGRTPERGGIGIEGVGASIGGTGVLGLGGGSTFQQDFGGNQVTGSGGIGVHGIGGANIQPSANDEEAGPGVVGEGGRQLDTDEKRASHGAGVIGFGGAISPIETGFKGPWLAAEKLRTIDAGGAGIFGLGAEMTTKSSGRRVSGPRNPGPGVVGVGGQEQNGERKSAAGIVGFSGFAPDPRNPILNNLPYAKTNGAGVFGMSKTGRGGVFASDGIAQLQLIPNPAGRDFEQTNTVAPVEVVTEKNDFKLPKDGKPGDFFAMSDAKDNKCILWFCVEGPGRSGALWAQVLLGTRVIGKA